MGLAVSPVRIAVVVAAAAWPLVAALAVVAWSRGRAARQAARVADLDAQLQGLYRTVELRPAPAHLASVIDALAPEEALAAPVPAPSGRSPDQPRG